MFEFPAARPSFRIDPWATDYGSSAFEEERQPRAKPPVRPFVETEEWHRGIAPPLVERPDCIVFVDGVQRTETFGFIEDGECSVRSALVSVGVGATICRRNEATIGPMIIERVLALSADCQTPPLEVPVGGQTFRFQPELPQSIVAEDTTGTQAINNAVNRRRRALERRLAEDMAGEDNLVVMDGRLLFDPKRVTPVVGLAKTIHEVYLEEPQRSLVLRLGAGERTPVFCIDYDTSSRYSWFLRLPYTRPIAHSLAGIVRLETPEVGETEAVRLANLTAAWLPAFASRPQHDPRAPQNLLPVGGLEKRLRHEMGDPLFIRRAIEDYLMQESLS
jgi:hypothetical protein